MEGVIVNFKGGMHTQYTDYMIVKVGGIENKDQAKELVSKKVVWKSPTGKEIIGKVSKAHGNKGAVRVKFEKGMPGQAVGQKVNIE